jgi:hypothetical protein
VERSEAHCGAERHSVWRAERVGIEYKLRMSFVSVSARDSDCPVQARPAKGGAESNASH